MTHDNPYARHDGPGGPDRPGAAGGGGPSSDERTFAIIAHLSALAAILLSVGWLTFVGPLIVWLVLRERGPLVRAASAGAFNFAIGITILGIIAWICFFTILLIPVAIVLWIVAFIAQIWCSIRGALAASRGEYFSYPFQVRILS
ncbi:DUF4870 domain-containing protein [Georgenia sp. Z1491]|uniref:DUF4870 domain-containing protein n=1 Tax=Georgenia sp. Z1491 TaxID=3416707 RepID=UPI003CF5CCAE